jgi:hypothetical protein
VTLPILGHTRVLCVALLVSALATACAANTTQGTASPGGAGTASGAPTTPQAGLAWEHYSDARFDFDHPSAWLAQHQDFACSFCSIEVELSQVQTPNPCVTVGNSTNCNGFRGVTLSPGQVFAAWWHWGMVANGVDLGVGEPILVGGRVARLRNGPAEEGCNSVADRSFVVQVVSPVAYNWEEFHACYHSADAGQIEPDLQRLLASVRWND